MSIRELGRSLAIVLAASLAASIASAATFTVRPGGDTKVVFTSKAPVETFEGRTDKMQGTITVDPAAVGDSITVHLEVDLASLDTGKKMRNRHMRENHLETDRYPKAVFDGATVRGAGKLEAGKRSAFEVDGTFTLHGVSRRLRAAAEVWLDASGKQLGFTATFPIALPDYQIKRPEFLFMKLAEVQQLRVSATASSSP